MVLLHEGVVKTIIERRF